MLQSTLDLCPQCGSHFETLTHTNGKQIAVCPSCSATQHPHTRPLMEQLGQLLVQHLHSRGVDMIRLHTHDLETTLGLRADALMPMLVRTCQMVMDNNDASPFIITADKEGLIKFRTTYSGRAQLWEKTVLTLFQVLDQLVKLTRHKGELETRYVDFQPLLENSEEQPLPPLPKGSDIPLPKHELTVPDLELVLENTVLDETTGQDTETPPTEVSSERPPATADNETAAAQTEEPGIQGGQRVAGVLSCVDARGKESRLGQIKVLQEQGLELAALESVASMTRTLLLEFPNFEPATRAITRQLTVRAQGSRYFKTEPLLLVGPPGIGKTSYCARLAELSGVPYKALPLGGTSSNRTLAGSERVWDTATPSLVLQMFLDHGIANPLLVLDELDKAGGSYHNGFVHDTLLGLLEPVSSRRWFDPFAMGHIDTSHVSWIATANETTPIPKALLTRFRVLYIEGPKTEHYPAIVWKARSDYARNYGIDPASMPVFTEQEWRWLEDYYSSPRLARRATQALLDGILSGARKSVLH